MKVNCTENVQAKTMTERRQTSTKQQKKSKDEKRVKFHQDIVFNEMIKDGESAEILNFLRRKSVDIDVNERNEHGRTALKNLIMNDNLKCVKVLVQQGADVNKEDENGRILEIFIFSFCIYTCKHMFPLRDIYVA